MYCKEIKPVKSKGNQSWIFIRRTDAEAETPILWPPRAKSWFIGKDPDAGSDWGQEEKGDDRGWDGWMASLTRWTWVWVNSGSWWWIGRPAYCDSWGRKELDMTEWRNWTEDVFYFIYSLVNECNFNLLLSHILISHNNLKPQRPGVQVWRAMPTATDCSLITEITKSIIILFWHKCKKSSQTWTHMHAER